MTLMTAVTPRTLRFGSARTARRSNDTQDSHDRDDFQDLARGLPGEPGWQSQDTPSCRGTGWSHVTQDTRQSRTLGICRSSPTTLMTGITRGTVDLRAGHAAVARAGHRPGRARLQPAARRVRWQGGTSDVLTLPEFPGSTALSGLPAFPPVMGVGQVTGLMRIWAVS